MSYPKTPPSPDLIEKYKEAKKLFDMDQAKTLSEAAGKVGLTPYQYYQARRYVIKNDGKPEKKTRIKRAPKIETFSLPTPEIKSGNMTLSGDGVQIARFLKELRSHV